MSEHVLITGGELQVIEAALYEAQRRAERFGRAYPSNPDASDAQYRGALDVCQRIGLRIERTPE